MRKIPLILGITALLIGLGGSTNEVRAGVGISQGFSTIAYKERDAGWVSYGGLGAEFFVRLERDLVTELRGGELLVDEQLTPWFIWYNYVDQPQDLPALTLGGAGYMLGTWEGMEYGAEAGVIFRGPGTVGMDIGAMAGMRAQYKVGPIPFEGRVAYGYIPGPSTHTHCVLVKLGVVLTD